MLLSDCGTWSSERYNIRPSNPLPVHELRESESRPPHPLPRYKLWDLSSLDMTVLQLFFHSFLASDADYRFLFESLPSCGDSAWPWTPSMFCLEVGQDPHRRKGHEDWQAELMMLEHTIGGGSKGQNIRPCHWEVVQKLAEYLNKAILGHSPLTEKGQDEATSIEQCWQSRQDTVVQW